MSIYLFYFVLYTSVWLCLCAITLLCVALFKLYKKHLKNMIIKSTQCENLESQIQDISVNYAYRQAILILKKNKKELQTYSTYKGERIKSAAPIIRRVGGVRYKKKITKSDNQNIS